MSSCGSRHALGVFGATMYGRWFVDGDRMSPFDSCSGVCGVEGCAPAFAVAGVCCGCVVVERILCGALDVPETSLRYVNGGGLLIYSIL